MMYSHRGYPRFPDLRPIGTPIPDSRPNRETGDFPIPAFGRIGNRGFPPRFPAKSGIGGTGIGDLGLWPTELATSHWQPLRLLTCVGGWKSAFSRIKGNIWSPDRVWYSHGMSIPGFPISAKSGIGDSLIPDFGRIGNRGFPPRFPAGIPDSRPNRESGERPSRHPRLNRTSASSAKPRLAARLTWPLGPHSSHGPLVLGQCNPTHSRTSATSLPHSQMGWMCIPTKAPASGLAPRPGCTSTDGHWQVLAASG